MNVSVRVLVVLYRIQGMHVEFNFVFRRTFPRKIVGTWSGI